MILSLPPRDPLLLILGLKLKLPLRALLAAAVAATVAAAMLPTLPRPLLVGIVHRDPRRLVLLSLSPLDECSNKSLHIDEVLELAPTLGEFVSDAKLDDGGLLLKLPGT